MVLQLAQGSPNSADVLRSPFACVSRCEAACKAPCAGGAAWKWGFALNAPDPPATLGFGSVEESSMLSRELASVQSLSLL